MEVSDCGPRSASDIKNIRFFYDRYHVFQYFTVSAWVCLMQARSNIIILDKIIHIHESPELTDPLHVFFGKFAGKRFDNASFIRQGKKFIIHSLLH